MPKLGRRLIHERTKHKHVSVLPPRLTTPAATTIAARHDVYIIIIRHGSSNSVKIYSFNIRTSLMTVNIYNRITYLREMIESHAYMNIHDSSSHLATCRLFRTTASETSCRRPGGVCSGLVNFFYIGLLVIALGVTGRSARVKYLHVVSPDKMPREKALLGQNATNK